MPPRIENSLSFSACCDIPARELLFAWASTSLCNAIGRSGIVVVISKFSEVTFVPFQHFHVRFIENDAQHTIVNLGTNPVVAGRSLFLFVPIQQRI